MPVAFYAGVAGDSAPALQINPDSKTVVGETRAGSRASDPRLAVILVADMVGYSRQMAEDEAGTHARFMALRLRLIEPAAAVNGARILKYTGDGFVAEFISATRAVWFAVKFQDAARVWSARHPPTRRLRFRIGINLGDVIVEPHDVFGHCVNVAYRLQAIARPGGVLVSQAVVASVRDPWFRFKDAGELSLKNIDEPVRGFHARLARGRSRVAARIDCPAGNHTGGPRRAADAACVPDRQ